MSDTITAADLYHARTRLIKSDFEAIARLVEGRSVLEVGSGTGRILKTLLGTDCPRLVGVERDIDKLRIAEKILGSDHRLKLIHGVFPDACPRKRFGRVLFAFNVFAEFLEVASRLRALQKARALLEPEGRIVLVNSVHEFGSWATTVAEHRFPIKDEQTGKWICSIECRRDQLRQLSRCRVTYSKEGGGHADVVDTYELALLTRNELLTLYEAADLTLAEEFGSYDLGPIGEKSEVMIHVLGAKR